MVKRLFFSAADVRSFINEVLMPGKLSYELPIELTLEANGETHTCIAIKKNSAASRPRFLNTEGKPVEISHCNPRTLYSEMGRLSVYLINLEDDKEKNKALEILSPYLSKDLFCVAKSKGISEKIFTDSVRDAVLSGDVATMGVTFMKMASEEVAKFERVSDYVDSHNDFSNEDYNALSYEEKITYHHAMRYKDSDLPIFHLFMEDSMSERWDEDDIMNSSYWLTHPAWNTISEELVNRGLVTFYISESVYADSIEALYSTGWVITGVVTLCRRGGNYIKKVVKVERKSNN